MRMLGRKTFFLETIGLIGFILLVGLLPHCEDRAFIGPLFAQTNKENVRRLKFFEHNETFVQPFTVSIPKINNDVDVEVRISISNIEITKVVLTSIPDGFSLSSDQESGIASSQDAYNAAWKGKISKENSGKQLAFSALVTTGDKGGEVASRVTATLKDISNNKEFESNKLNFDLAVVGTAEIKLKAVANKTQDGKSFEKFVDFPEAPKDGEKPKEEPKIFPGAQLRYEITWKSGVNFPIKLEDHLLIARLSSAVDRTANHNNQGLETPIISASGNPVYTNTSTRQSIDWKLKDIFGEEAPANAQTTQSYTVQLKDEIDFSVKEVSAEPYTYEPTETGAKYQGPLVVKDLWSEVFVEFINYHGKPIESVFIDLFKHDDDKSIIESDVLKDHITDAEKGTYSATIKRKNISNTGELRLGVAFANSDLGMGFRTGAFLPGDILNIRTKKLEIEKDRITNIAFKFGSVGKSSKSDAISVVPADWEFPEINKNAQYHKQTQMASVIWSNYVKAKGAMNELTELKKDETLSVNFLPPSNNAFSYVQNETVYLSHKAWEPRQLSRYSPHTEFHEFSHWLLRKKGIDRVEGIAPPKIEFPLDVPLKPQLGSIDCGITAVEMVGGYLKHLEGEPYDLFARKACPTGGISLDVEIAKNFPSKYVSGYKFADYPDGLNANNADQFFRLINSSLDKGFPVVIGTSFSTGYGGHFLAIVGYDQNGIYTMNDPAEGTQIKSWGGKPLNRANIIDHSFHVDSNSRGFYYWTGEPLENIGVGEFKGYDSAHFGYANKNSNHSLIEGIAIQMALEIEKIISKEVATTKYQDEQKKTLYNLAYYNPAFVTFGKSSAKKADSQGEGWVVASLLNSLANGLPRAASSSTVGWLNSKDLKPYTVSNKTVGYDNLLKIILGWQEQERTVAGLRHRLAAQAQEVTLENKNGDKLKTTDIDLFFGLYGFFTDRGGNWVLDSSDFSPVACWAKNTNCLLGSAAHSLAIEKRISDIDYPEVSSVAVASFEPLPSKSLGKIGQPFTKKGETIKSTDRNSSGTTTFKTGPRLQRREPLEISGSQILVNSNTKDEIGIIVDIVVNEPNNNLSYTDESTIVPGQPWNIHLPYPTVGSVAVIRFKNSADWLVIDSDQYWSLVGSDTPPAILAEKNIALSGSTPSLNSVLAAAGYSVDGRKVGKQSEPEDDDEIKLSPEPDEPAELPTEKPATQGESPKPKPEITIIENIIDTESGEENLVKANTEKKSVAPGDSLRIRIAGLQGPTAKVLFDGKQISEIPLTGDAQQIIIPINKDVRSGEHKLQVTDNTGTTLELPIKVKNVTLSLLLLTMSLILLILFFVYVYLQITKAVRFNRTNFGQKPRSNNLVNFTDLDEKSVDKFDQMVAEDSESFFDATKVKPEDLESINNKDE